ncbi:MAG: hypothetical protein Q7U43_17600 [Methylococcaceae bacterium]|nr:hypothetical protein [Methylococcaceae bacterium]MDP2394930.1 hypothetical protein [Methylococcaceae bacterium]
MILVPSSLLPIAMVKWVQKNIFPAALSVDTGTVSCEIEFAHGVTATGCCAGYNCTLHTAVGSTFFTSHKDFFLATMTGYRIVQSTIYRQIC